MHVRWTIYSLHLQRSWECDIGPTFPGAGPISMSTCKPMVFKSANSFTRTFQIVILSAAGSGRDLGLAVRLGLKMLNSVKSLGDTLELSFTAGIYGYGLIFQAYCSDHCISL